MTDLPASQLESLLNRIAQGDEQAFTTLYRHYQRFVYAYLRHRVIDADAIEEILQDTLHAVFQKPLAYDGRSKFSTWLCSIANHKVGDWARRRRRQVETEDADEDFIETVADPDWDFLAQIAREQEMQVLRDCMDALPEKQRIALFWTFFEDEALETVAERQECPVGTVKSRLFNARQSVADCVRRIWGAKR